MEAYAMSKGITTAWSELSSANQTMLRYNYLMEMTSSMQGDFIRTQDSYANSVRTLKNNFAQLKAEIGTSLIAVLAPVVKVIGTIIAYLTALAQAFNNFLRSIGLLKGSVGGVADSIGEIADSGAGLGGISDGIGGIGDSAGGSAGKVKDLKKELKGLMSIDELNKLPEISDSASGGGAGGGSGAGAGGGGLGSGLTIEPIDMSGYTGSIETALEEAKKKIAEFGKFLKDNAGVILAVLAGIGAGITTYLGITKWGTIVAVVKSAVGGIVSSLSALVGAISLPALAIASAVALFVAGFTYLYVECEDFRNRVNSLFADVGRTLKKCYDSIIAPIFKGIKAIYNDILKPVLMWIWDLVLTVVEAVWGAIENAWKVIKPCIDFLCDAFTQLYDSIEALYKENIKPFIDWLIPILSAVWGFLKPILSALIEALGYVAGVIGGAVVVGFGMLVNALTWVIDAFKFLIDIISVVVKGVVTFFVELGKAIKSNWESVSNWWKETWANMKKTFATRVDDFKKSIENFKEGCAKAWELIKKKFTDTWNGIKALGTAIVKAIKDKITEFANKCKEAWQSIKDLFEKRFNQIKEFATNVATWLMDKFKNAVNKVKEAWQSIPDWFKERLEAIKNFFSPVADWFGNLFNNAKERVKSAFSAVKDFITNPIESAKNTIKGIIDKIVGFFKVKITFPNIPLPHFSLSPSGWKIGDLLKGSIPKLDIKWYAKGGIMTNPTMFAMSGNTAHIGGEKGAEGIIPLSKLWEQMDKFANTLISGVLSTTDKEITINTYLDGEKVASNTVKHINNKTRRSGHTPIIIK